LICRGHDHEEKYLSQYVTYQPAMQNYVMFFPFKVYSLHALTMMLVNSGLQ